MSVRRFKKQLIQNRVMVGGRDLSYEFTIDNTGVVVLDDEENPELAAELSKLCGRYGISEISEAQYEDLKKKTPSPKRGTQSPPLRIFETAKDPFASRRLQKPLVVSDLSQVPPLPQAQPPAPIAKAPASAQPAVASSPAAPVTAPATSPSETVKFKPRTGTVKSKKK